MIFNKEKLLALGGVHQDQHPEVEDRKRTRRRSQSRS